MPDLDVVNPRHSPRQTRNSTMMKKRKTFPFAMHEALPTRNYFQALHAKKKTRAEEPELRGEEDDEGR